MIGSGELTNGAGHKAQRHRRELKAKTRPSSAKSAAALSRPANSAARSNRKRGNKSTNKTGVVSIAPCKIGANPLGEGTMNDVNFAPYYDRLRTRRDEIIITQKHLAKEQRVVDENEDWLDRAAYESRVDLLDDLTEWYAKEIVQVEGALARFAQGKYGICLACHRRIEAERLDTAPEASFCASCQSTREALAEM